MSTADAILQTLNCFDLRDEGGGKWRCNSPLRLNSNSHAFCLKIDGPEHGTWIDQASSESGSLYQLADLLGIPTPTAKAPASSKRGYDDLADYAQHHGVPAKAYSAWGWTETTRDGRPALQFPTANGPRWRFLDGAKPPFTSQAGYSSCWYGLSEAVALATATSQPLVLCNGEPSVVASQHWGVPACCATNSGEKLLPQKLLAELQAAWSGPILVALDSDAKGRAAAPKLAAQVAGQVVDLGGGVGGFDLADFCALHQPSIMPALLANAQPVAPSATPQAAATNSPLTDANLTDAGNAESLIAIYRDTLRYCHTRKRWLVWESVRWRLDEDGSVRRYALDAIRQRYHAAANIPDFIRRKKLADWAIGSESVGRIKAMLDTAGTMHPMTTTIALYDSNPMLAGVSNGALELQAGTLRAAQRDDYITMNLGCAFDPHATCPRWLQFLDEVFLGDQEVIAFIQRAIGYCLTGDIREEVIFLLIGEGANGKSKFLEVLRQLLSDYAAVASFETFNAERSSDQTNDLAALAGKRLVIAIETDEDRRLAEARVKMITGGDRISCRFLYGEYFTYPPQFKLWLAMNHKPAIRGRDNGIWRRIRLIPFSQSFEQNPDKLLIGKLVAELPGILNWALVGLAEWHTHGLGYPAPIRAATEKYRHEMDVIAQWLDEETIDDVQDYLTASDAYSAYRDWATKRGERYPLTQTAWGRSMNKRYTDQRKTINGRKVTIYQGVRFRTLHDPP